MAVKTTTTELERSRVRVEVEVEPAAVEKELAAVPESANVTLRTSHLSYIDHTTSEMIADWAERREGGTRMSVDRSAPSHERRLANALPA